MAKHSLLAAGLLICAAVAGHANVPPSPKRSPVVGPDRGPLVPGEILRFAERRRQCERRAGEGGHDMGGRRAIDQEGRDRRCVTITRDEQALRRRYARRLDVLQRLDRR